MARTLPPWSMELRHDRWVVFSYAYEDEVPLVAKGSRRFPMSREDATLISAAPDLLEALRALADSDGLTFYHEDDTEGAVKCCVHCHKFARTPAEIAHEASCIVGKARAAIAKAEGRS